MDKLQAYLETLMQSGRKRDITVRAVICRIPRTGNVGRYHFGSEEERGQAVATLRMLGATLIGEREG